VLAFILFVLTQAIRGSLDKSGDKSTNKSSLERSISERSVVT
jgi:hypothetical protein